MYSGAIQKSPLPHIFWTVLFDLMKFLDQKLKGVKIILIENSVTTYTNLVLQTVYVICISYKIVHAIEN